MLSPSRNPRFTAVALCIVATLITARGAPILSQPNEASSVGLYSLAPDEVQDPSADTRRSLVVREPERHVTLQYLVF